MSQLSWGNLSPVVGFIYSSFNPEKRNTLPDIAWVQVFPFVSSYLKGLYIEFRFPTTDNSEHALPFGRMYYDEDRAAFYVFTRDHNDSVHYSLELISDLADPQCMEKLRSKVQKFIPFQSDGPVLVHQGKERKA